MGGRARGLEGATVAFIAWRGYVATLPTGQPDEMGFVRPAPPLLAYLPWLFLLAGVLLFWGIAYADLRIRGRAKKKPVTELCSG